MNDEKVEQLLSDLRLTNPTGYDLVQEVRKTAYSAVPKATECVMYGGFMFAATVKFCGVFAYTEHVSIEFGRWVCWHYTDQKFELATGKHNRGKYHAI